MVLLGDVGHVESQFGPFGDSANLDASLLHGLCRTYHSLKSHFGRTRWNSYMMWVLWNLISVRLETVLVSVQDRCTVCAKRTIAQKSFWIHVTVLLGYEVQVKARFGTFRDSAQLNAG